MKSHKSRETLFRKFSSDNVRKQTLNLYIISFIKYKFKIFENYYFVYTYIPVCSTTAHIHFDISIYNWTEQILEIIVLDKNNHWVFLTFQKGNKVKLISSLFNKRSMLPTPLLLLFVLHLLTVIVWLEFDTLDKDNSNIPVQHCFHMSNISWFLSA